MNRKLIHSAGFVRAARRFVKRQPHMLNEIRDTLLLMERDAFDPKLRTHKYFGFEASFIIFETGFCGKLAQKILTFDQLQS